MAFTLAQITQAVQDTLETNEPTFVANIPVFIKNTEERILKSIRLNVFRKNAAGNVTANNKFLALPINFLAPKSLSIIVDGEHFFLEQKNSDFVQTVGADPTDTDVPRYYAQYDVENFILAPTPDDNYLAEINYMYRPDSLADGAPDGTTWLSVNAADCLLYGCLHEAAIFQKAEEDVTGNYFNRFGEALQRLKNFGEGLETIDDFRYGQLRLPRS